ncbi:hypothetical protein KKD57_05975 [Patescibacteria group bacterium]|nr:hypothetical protein [Patescibacteria group bacterium]
MLRKFFRHRKYKKMIKGSSSFIIEEFAKIVAETIEHFKKEGKIKTPEKKEVLKFEATALVFWLFRGATMFEKTWHRLLLDEIHHQYYKQLRKRGYDFKLRQIVNDDFNLRYKTYDDALGDDNDFAKVGIKFVRFLSERSKTDLDVTDMMIPLCLTKKLTPKFEEWKEMMKN